MAASLFYFYTEIGWSIGKICFLQYATHCTPSTALV